VPLDELPKPEFHLRKKHLWHILDVAVIAALFMGAGQIYLDTRGVKVSKQKEAERAAAQVEGAELLEQADSVVTATAGTLKTMLSDSTQSFGELQRMRAEFEGGLLRGQQLRTQIFPLSENVIAMRDRTQEALATAQGYERDVVSRESEIDSLRRRATSTEEVLASTRTEREQVAQNLYQARRAEAHDPTGRFPSKTGVMLRRDVSQNEGVTNLELQQVLWNPGGVDLGFALGVGVGSERTASNKEVGLLLTRPLIHRRLGLDFGAGYSVLTQQEGADKTGAFASAGLRLSPFYKERLHLGIGARARAGEVIPFLGVSIGRR
jgi:hypothetical protein